MGQLFRHYLEDPRIYCCITCQAHLSSHDSIVSKSFQGRHGRAYLFDKVVNVKDGPKEDRMLLTGLHTVADIMCIHCNTVLGWRYLQAYESSQKYKEGKFIMEKAKIVKENNWA
eukprot:Colp12_sorted_trinity150504_noHs@26932